MKKYFLDCGSNVGQSTKYFITNNIIDTNTEIHLFEPNKISLEISRENLKNYSDYNINYHSCAIWKENCHRQLTVEFSPGDYKCQLSDDIIPGNNNSGGATNIMENEWKKPDYILDEYITSGGLVECIDFSEWLKNNIEEDSNVICKMDIEGAEYEVLGKLIDDDTLNIINSLYIEWHNHLLSENFDTSMFVKEIESKNIKIETWI